MKRREFISLICGATTGLSQAPTKYQLVLNLQTARKQNVSFPQTLLALANEVIE